MDWLPANKISIKPIQANNTGDDPIEIYRHRYLYEAPEINLEESVVRVWDEVFSYFDINASVLLFGSGHSYWANQYKKFPNIAKVSVLDYVVEAGVGLESDIDFYCQDLLVEGVTGTYDYIYSAHTVEHFDPEQVLNKVLPVCMAAAKKAVVFLTPYGMAWAEEPSHKSVFYENDELAARASKYKIIRGGLELVLWFDVEDGI